MATRKPNGLTFSSMGVKPASKAAAQGITYWSFSLYSSYKECPLKAKLNAVDKIKEPGNDAMQRGTDVHKLCEDYVKGALTLPQLKAKAKLVTQKPWSPEAVVPELMRLRKVYANRGKLAAKAQQPTVEETWAFTKDWEQTRWNDWVACWVRIKLDVGEFMELGDGTLVYVPTDWKTGRYREEKHAEYLEQLELYALAALLIYPHVDEVRPRLVYVDEGLTIPGPDAPLVIHRRALPALLKTWAKRVKPMLSDRTFAPRPGQGCRFCFYRKSNAANGGGQCKY